MQAAGPLASAEMTDSDIHHSSISRNFCSQMPLRIGILMDHPSPHMGALLEAIAAREDCTLEVLYCGSGAPGRNWGSSAACVPHRFLKGYAGPLGIRFNPEILQTMNRLRVDVWVVNTIYDSFTSLMAAWWLRFRGKPWAFMNEPMRPRSRLCTWLKELPLNFVLNRADGIIGTGKAAVEAYQRRFRKDCPYESVPYFIDLSPFSNLPSPEAPQDGQDLQFVTSCQMIRRKGIDCLLRACEGLPETGWHLTLVGDGPLRSRLMRASALSIRHGKISFSGAIPYANRAMAFANRHVFILPSRWDGWGMVLPEALAAGLPVISTNQVVSAHEFIKDGENGFIVPAGDSQALANKMMWFIRNTSLHSRMSVAARKSLKNYRPDMGAETLVAYLRNLNAGISPKQNANCWPPAREPITWHLLATPGTSSERAMLSMRRLGKDAIIRGNLLMRQRIKAKGHLILAYHLILKEDRGQFEDHIRFLSDYFQLSSLHDLLGAAASKNQNACRLAITFDDGFRLLMHDCLEILEKHGIKASFFVPAAFVSSGSQNGKAAEFSTRSFYYSFPLEPMRPEDLRQLAGLGHEVGSHGLFHTSIHAMMPESAQRDLMISRSMICEWTGVAPDGFSYPYGESLSSLGSPASWLRQAGFTYGLTMVRGSVDRAANPYALPRHHLEGNWPIRALRHFLLA